MWDFINTYSAEIVSTAVLLTPLAYAIKGRIVNDKNILNTFQVAKQSIMDSNNIKFDVQGSIEKVKNHIDRIETHVNESINYMNQTVLEFQEDELYQKMLVGLSELDELHQTLQNKDSTIEMLGKELKETKLALLEIKNLLKE